jgi:hypothetical protein
MPTVAPRIEMPPIGYSNYGRPVTERPLRNGAAVLTEQEITLPKYVEIPVDREKTLQSIAFLTQYMEDLKAGKPVENLSPSNDPYYLVPENIATWIDREKSLLKEKPMGIVFTSMKDLIGEWENI